MDSDTFIVIRTKDPEDDRLLKSLSVQLDESGIEAKGVEEPLRDVSGKAMAPVFLLLLAAPAVIKLAEKLGDAIVEWVKSKKPDTEIVLEYSGRKVAIHTNQISPGEAGAVTAQITALISGETHGRVGGAATVTAAPAMGGSHGGGGVHGGGGIPGGRHGGGG